MVSFIEKTIHRILVNLSAAKIARIRYSSCGVRAYMKAHVCRAVMASYTNQFLISFTCSINTWCEKVFIHFIPIWQTCVLFLATCQRGSVTFSSSIWGPTCDGLDRIIEDTQLPELNDGDWIYFRDMGSYTLAAGSTFNGIPRPRVYYIAEVKMAWSVW